MNSVSKTMHNCDEFETELLIMFHGEIVDRRYNVLFVKVI